MGTPQPRSEGSCLLILLPVLVGLGLSYYGLSQGFKGTFDQLADYLAKA